MGKGKKKVAHRRKIVGITVRPHPGEEMVRGPRFELGTPRFSVYTSFSDGQSLGKMPVFRAT